MPALKAGLPVFVDKPIAGSVTDAVAMFELGRHFKTPLFCSSSLRFSNGPQALRAGSIGKILGCSTYSPCSLEKTHPDLFWYGIHGVEMLFTVMGTGLRIGDSREFEKLRTRHRNLGRRTDWNFPWDPIRQERIRRHCVRRKRHRAGWQVRRLQTAGCRDRKVLQDEEGSSHGRGDSRNLRFHGSFRPKANARTGAPVTLASVMKKARAEAAKKVKEILARK